MLWGLLSSAWATPCTDKNAADNAAARIDFLKCFIAVSLLAVLPLTRLSHGWLRADRAQAHRVEIAQPRPSCSFHATLPNAFGHKGLH
jgi:hypothetical protein